MSKKYLRPSTVLGVCSLSALAIAAGCSGQGDETLGAVRSADTISADLVISQVYGGGGGSGASHKNDFVEIFNRGTQAVSLNGKTLQYAAAGSSFVNNNAGLRVALDDVTLQPGRYFLVQMSSAGNPGVALPTADQATTVNMAQGSGKIALVPSGALLAGCGDDATPCASNTFIDLVGFGASASQAEGTKTPNLSTTTAAIRKNGGCTDTGNNLADFDIATPTPRNSSTAAHLCGGGNDDAGSDASTDDGGSDAGDIDAGDIDAGTSDAGETDNDAGPDSGTEPDAGNEPDSGTPFDAGPPPNLVLLNEVKINPPGANNTPDAPWEYAEVLCTPGASLDGYYFVALEGDGDSSTGSPGVADVVVSLAGHNCGSNGLAYVKAATGGHPSGAAATTVITSTALDTGTSPLENATTSFVIVKSPSTAITATTDYDANDDGTLELPADASIVDGVSVFQQANNTTDHTYAPQLTIAAGPPDGATRLVGNTTPLSANAWYGGDLSGSDPEGLTYDASKKTANMPSGAVLTPGAPNYAGTSNPKPDAGSSSSGGTTPDPDPDPSNPGGSSGSSGKNPASSSGGSDDSRTSGGDSGGCAVTTSPTSTSSGFFAAIGAFGLAVLGIRRRRSTR